MGYVAWQRVMMLAGGIKVAKPLTYKREIILDYSDGLSAIPRMFKRRRSQRGGHSDAM